MKKLKLSSLDEVIMLQDDSLKAVFERSVEDAKHIEQLGYHRVWFAEHHNMANIMSSATSLLISHIAANTKQIRVGSGGIMLPNHAPIIVAEQFGTLDTIYPNRIDLGVGRAPGSDRITAVAVRRNNLNRSEFFKDDIIDIQNFFTNTNEQSIVRAFPGEGANVPIFILGSSPASAALAAELGLPYVFAGHFAPAMLKEAADIYRKSFKPSKFSELPYLVVCVNIIAAQSKQEAYQLSSSLFNLLSGVITNEPHLLAPPTSRLIYEGQGQIERAVTNMTAATFIGDRKSLSTELSAFIELLDIDEIMMTNYVFNHEQKLDSFTITKQALSHLM